MTTAPTSVRLVEGEARRFGELDLIARLGQGGMAEVFLAARRERPAQLLVLKRLKADLDDVEHRTMFEDEARIMPLLHHPNVVRTTDVGQQDGQRYLAMEYLDGLPLDQCKEVVSSLGERAALHVVGELLEGLHYAHELRDQEGQSLDLVHRDVSPHNVFITYEGRVTVVDFGIAKSRSRAQHTATGVVRGKLSYMAPEQALCDTLDRRADVFATGVILWELLAGRSMWDGFSDVQILKSMTFGELPKLADAVPGIRPELAQVVERALTAMPDDRYPTARAFREAIAKVAVGSFRRDELGSAVSVGSKGYRAALRAVVDAHLVEARGTAGLSGMFGDAATSTRAEAGEIEAVPAENAPASTRVEERPALEKAITQTGAATIVEVSAPPSPIRTGRARLVYAGLAAVAVLAVAVFAGMKLTQGASGAVADPGAAPVAEADNASVQLRIDVKPASAAVYLDDMRVAQLPLSASFPRDRAGHKLRVEADGFVSKSQIIVFDRDLDIDVQLEALAGGSQAGSSAEPVESAAIAAPTSSHPRPRVIRPRDVRTAQPTGRLTAPSTAPATPGTGGFIETDPWKKGGQKPRK